MYNKQELINAAAQEIKSVFEDNKNDLDITSVYVRLQLVDGSYDFHTGDNSYDTDHRGYWGYTSVEFERDLITSPEGDLIEIAVDDIDVNVLAEELVKEAIDNLLEHATEEEYKDIYNITPLETCKVKELNSSLFEFTDSSENISNVLEMIGISDLDDSVGSLYWEYCDGEIGEVWYLEDSTAYVYSVAKRIR